MPLTLASLFCGQIKTSSRQHRSIHVQCSGSLGFISTLTLTPTLVLHSPDLRTLNLLQNFGPTHVRISWIHSLMLTLTSGHNWTLKLKLYSTSDHRGSAFPDLIPAPEPMPVACPLFYALTISDWAYCRGIGPCSTVNRL